MSRPRTLVIAWGNPGRQDDGLGPAFARELEARCPAGVTVTRVVGEKVGSWRQLQVEDAADVAAYSRVVFVDADRDGAEPFWVRRLEAADNGLAFSTHSVAPDAVLALARDFFGSEPEAWLVGIRGYEFDDFGEELSEPARSNLADAVTYIEVAVESDSMREVRSPQGVLRTDPDL